MGQARPRPVGRRGPACLHAISHRRPPAVLPDTVGRKRVPYLDVDPARSVGAATGFGVFSDDLIDRILRGDLRHRRAGAEEAL